MGLTIDDIYSTAEIVEKQRENQRRKVSDQVEAGREVPIMPTASPRDRYTDSEWREREEDKSLEGLLTLARREMEQEKQLKKVNTTYNNQIKPIVLITMDIIESLPNKQHGINYCHQC